jgi:hypothetical protein
MGGFVMKLAVMQPYFFPYIGYFQLINAVDKFILYDLLQYTKRSWITRNRLITLNQGVAYYSIPVEKKSINNIRDVKIFNEIKWKEKVLKGITRNYNKAEYFNEVYPFIEHIFKKRFELLKDFNFFSVKAVSEYLGISAEIVNDNGKYEKMENMLKNETDSKDRILSGLQAEDIKTRRVMEICKIEDADVYINPIGGMKLYDKQIFQRNGIKLLFVNTLSYSYKQFNSEFIPNLSILDVLMNCGKDQTKNLLSNYDLI